jgi:cob(I)alamin adenosyltransferase
MSSTGKTKIYTKVGDKGYTSLYNGEKRSKDDDIFEALGDLDELSAEIGLLYHVKDVNDFEEIIYHSAYPDNGSNCIEFLKTIQSRLLDIGSHLATPASSSTSSKVERVKFDKKHLEKLEELIDLTNERLPTLKNFILPCTQANKCRVVARRAERHVIKVFKFDNDNNHFGDEDYDPIIIAYLNRLSSYFFILERCLNKEEILYKKA